MAKDRENCNICSRRTEKLRFPHFHNADGGTVCLLCSGRNVDDWAYAREKLTSEKYSNAYGLNASWPLKWGVFPGCAYSDSFNKYRSQIPPARPGKAMSPEMVMEEERTHGKSQYKAVIIGPPCTGKTTLVEILRENHLTVIDMDELMFDNEKRRWLFEATGNNFPTFCLANPGVVADMAKEWNSMVRDSDVAMVWPLWLYWFNYPFTRVYATQRDSESWINCIKANRWEGLLEQMKERSTLKWTTNHLPYLEECFSRNNMYFAARHRLTYNLVDIGEQDDQPRLD